MDKLWAMQIFMRVMECGSFSRAAESLNLANATVTSSIRNLEKHLGVTLIQRNTRHIRLTEEGEFFFPRCREILNAVSVAENEVRGQANEVSGVLKVEAPFAIGQSLLGYYLPKFAKRYPKIKVSLNLTNEPRNLIERSTDVAIRMDSVEDADLVARPVYEAKYIVCGAPSLVDSLGDVHPRDIDPRICLGLFKDNYLVFNQWMLRKDNEQVLLQPEGIINSNNTGVLIESAIQGAGLIYILDIFAEEFFKENKLKPMFLNWETSVRVFHAVTVKSRFASENAKAFIEFLREVLDVESRPRIGRQIQIESWKRRKKQG